MQNVTPLHAPIISCKWRAWWMLSHGRCTYWIQGTISIAKDQEPRTKARYFREPGQLSLCSIIACSWTRGFASPCYKTHTVTDTRRKSYHLMWHSLVTCCFLFLSHTCRRSRRIGSMSFWCQGLLISVSGICMTLNSVVLYLKACTIIQRKKTPVVVIQSKVQWSSSWKARPIRGHLHKGLSCKSVFYLSNVIEPRGILLSLKAS